MKYRDRRRPTDFEIVLLTAFGRKALNVLDVSTMGLRVCLTDLEVEPEDPVVVEFRGETYPSRVTWVKANEAGVEFDRPLPPDMHALISRSTKTRKRSRFLFK